jgi:hypothetical protein
MEKDESCPETSVKGSELSRISGSEPQAPGGTVGGAQGDRNFRNVASYRSRPSAALGPLSSEVTPEPRVPPRAATVTSSTPGR